MNKIIFSKYSNERAKDFCIRTDICQDEAGNRWVEKHPMNGAAKAHIEGMIRSGEALSELWKDTKISVNQCGKSGDGIRLEYLEGVTLEEKLDERLQAQDMDGLAGIIADYFWILEKAAVQKEWEMQEAFTQVFGSVKGIEELKVFPVSDVDMIFSNILVQGAQWQLIDYEWTFDFPVPVKFVKYRCLFYYIQGNAKRLGLEKEGLYRRFGITKKEMQIFAGMEAHFQRYILGAHLPIRLLYDEISQGVTYMKPVIEKACEDRRKRALQVFYNYGEGYLERYSKVYQLEEGPVTLIIPIPEGVKNLRIDPCSESSILHLKNLSGNKGPLKFTTNGFCTGEGIFVYQTTDPQIIVPRIPDGVDQVKLEYQLTFLRGLALDVMLSLHNQAENSKEKVRQMEGTRAWKLNQKIRKITGRR